MKYTIEFEPNQLQFVVNLLENSPLPYKEVAPIMGSIKQQVDAQNDIAKKQQQQAE